MSSYVIFIERIYLVLEGKTCTFSSPLQPGSTYTFPLDINTVASAPAGTYPLAIVGDTLQSFELGASEEYTLIILPTPAPSPVIVSPLAGQQFMAGQPIALIGYAPTTEAYQFGDVPCYDLQFYSFWTRRPDGYADSGRK